MSGEIDTAEVERIARLARLALTAEEKALYARQLTRILEYARQVAELDTTGVPAMARADEGAEAQRRDQVQPSLPREAAMANAPEALAGLFVVPRALTE
jgi:aspartyl-tRNA(Asn)/glutamyl-tRNA(Gln) amidotransferase subunit C